MKFCPVCGTEAPDSARHCDYCDNMFVFESDPVPEKKRENIPAGILGAMIGAVIGGAAIILVSRLGFVASLCGVILAVCTMKGYELLAGSMGKAGVVICLALILVTPYLADRLDWAIVLMMDYKQQYAEALPVNVAFALVPDMIREGVIGMSDYVATLVKLYIFTLLGGVGSLIGALKKK